ncbi:hypothetical protein PR048_007642 [Dryococelus australis]|uniref:DDE Tnp4 domain-containing protein n=1 Tax=Dryococelus australis TaxID=614101 RepID=A0ABQ9HV18_9NEOP|nr:hypothetical protein PR048_007642 [Dryococelus australis]
MRKSIPAEKRLVITLRWKKSSQLLDISHQSADTQHGFLPLMMQGIVSGTVVYYHQMMSVQMDTGRCNDEFEECQMGRDSSYEAARGSCVCVLTVVKWQCLQLSQIFYFLASSLLNESRKLFHHRSRSTAEKKNTSLLYLATGCTFTDLHYIFKCGISTTRKIVIEVCETVCHPLHDFCFPDLTEDEWLKIANGFTFVDIGSYGKASDSAIYQNSLLFQKPKVNALHVPSDKTIRMGGEPLPCTFVGDEAFALSTHMQRPYCGKNYVVGGKRKHTTIAFREGFSFGILTN